MNNVLGGQHLLVKNVRGSLFGGWGKGRRQALYTMTPVKLALSPSHIVRLVVRAVRVCNRGLIYRTTGASGESEIHPR